MPAGGFVGESKHEILLNLKNVASSLPYSTILRQREPADRVEQAQAFMQSHQLSFPIVLKPDAGQRGSGVAIVRSSQQLQEYLGQEASPTILQEYVPGKEFGVFYVRYPGDVHGRVFSVTEKRMPVVVGDGCRTLEELILADDRAVCMADSVHRFSFLF
jgi:carbamoylphosphate synthase large subunit